MKPNFGTTLFDTESEWQNARAIYPLYCALARESAIDVSPCDAFDRGADYSDESLASVREWFTKMDESIQIHQFRHFFQTASQANAEALQALLLHHLHKSERNDSDRNKIDFLLVQFFSLSAPSQLPDEEVNLAYVAGLLGPVLGQFDLTEPEWLQPLEGLAEKSQNCRTLKEMFTSRIIEQGRKLKESCGQNYYLPVALTAFTRFGFLLRRVFFRLMHQDLSAILDGLRELESRGIEGLDCRRAQFSAYEPMLRLRMICQSWKVMFHAEYSAGQPLCLLVDLRTVVDAALAKSIAKSAEKGESAPEHSFAAAAGAGFGSTSSSSGSDRGFRDATPPPDDQGSTE